MNTTYDRDTFIAEVFALAHAGTDDYKGWAAANRLVRWFESEIMEDEK